MVQGLKNARNLASPWIYEMASKEPRECRMGFIRVREPQESNGLQLVMGSAFLKFDQRCRRTL